MRQRYSQLEHTHTIIYTHRTVPSTTRQARACTTDAVAVVFVATPRLPRVVRMLPLRTTDSETTEPDACMYVRMYVCVCMYVSDILFVSVWKEFE